MDNNNPENNSTGPSFQDNGSASRDSYLTEDNSKDAAVNNGVQDGDDNLSPISDSELEDDLTNDTTDARPVSPVPETEPLTQSNDGDKEDVVNDNEAAQEEKSSPVAEEDTNTGDVEMQDLTEKTEPVISTEEPSAEQENNNTESQSEPPPPASPQPPEESAEITQEAPEEPMDVDETDKAKKANEVSLADTQEANSFPENKVGDDSKTNEDGQMTAPPEEVNVQPDEMVSENNSMAYQSEDHLRDENTSDKPAETAIASTEPDNTHEMDTQTNENSSCTMDNPSVVDDANDEKNVQEVDIGTFRDVQVNTDVILSREMYNKIIEETQKNISK